MDRSVPDKDNLLKEIGCGLAEQRNVIFPCGCHEQYFWNICPVFTVQSSQTKRGGSEWATTLLSSPRSKKRFSHTALSHLYASIPPTYPPSKLLFSFSWKSIYALPRRNSIPKLFLSSKGRTPIIYMLFLHANSAVALQCAYREIHS